VDTTNSVPAATMEALRQQSDRIGKEGFQLAGVFFSDTFSDPAQFATTVANKNGIGSKDKDNGILIMVLLDRSGDNNAPKPYIFVAIGSGLEGLLNDAKVTRFREDYFNPKRADGKWQEGLVLLSTKLGDYLADPKADEFRDISNDSGLPFGLPLWALILIAIIVLLILGAMFYGAYITYGSSGSSGGFFGGGDSGGGSFGGGGGFGGGGSGG
jgi:uncharacterized protein